MLEIEPLEGQPVVLSLSHLSTLYRHYLKPGSVREISRKPKRELRGTLTVKTYLQRLNLYPDFLLDNLPHRLSYFHSVQRCIYETGDLFTKALFTAVIGYQHGNEWQDASLLRY